MTLTFTWTGILAGIGVAVVIWGAARFVVGLWYLWRWGK